MTHVSGYFIGGKRKEKLHQMVPKNNSGKNKDLGRNNGSVIKSTGCSYRGLDLIHPHGGSNALFWQAPSMNVIYRYMRGQNSHIFKHFKTRRDQ